MLPAGRQPSPGDHKGLATARERFLTAESVEPYPVRDTILASWWRSRRSRVAADRIDLSYIRDPDPDTPLSRSAMPVLRSLRDALDGQPISVILTDADGLVLSRLAADTELDRHLDGVRLAPGFSYAEEYVGTNGIGTALEGGQPMQVFGHEHYAEHLEDLACAAVPIKHPVSGRTVGAVDLTCWRKDADPLLIALAKTTADQITRALLADSSAEEVQLLQEYLRACKRTSGMVLALSRGIVMINDYARQVLDPADQAVLLGQAADALDSGQHGPVEVALPTGGTARLYCRALHGAQSARAGVVHVRLTDRASRRGQASLQPTPHGRMYLPGLAGAGPLWLRGCSQVEAAHASGEWLALGGEPGTGKVAVLRAVHQRRNPAGRFHVVDATELADPDWFASLSSELATESGSLVIRRVDRLTPGRMHQLTSALQESVTTGRHHSLWVAVTLGHTEPGGDLMRLMRYFPCTVELSPRTLPPECRTISRRLLSTLEAMERDAIVESLLDFDGSKVKAAESLGMSRATIYRKIHEYGIVIPAG